jgi:uncharacterized protein YegJ (DUF2314 family)
MSKSKASKVFMFDNDDPEMQRAYQRARANFRFFWREIAWERRRIVPTLDLSCVKAPFSDNSREKRSKNDPEVEHMWMNEVDFDGQLVSGVLLNSPNWLKSVKAGDSARLPLEEISDWMYAREGVVYGAYSVNLMRSRMGKQERKEHDNAWGLDFGDPDKIRVVPQPKQSGGLLKSWFGKQMVEDIEKQEHPMSDAMASSLKERLEEEPSMLEEPDDNGWTLLHHQALAGSAATVKVLLERGANPNSLTSNGMTPRELAKSLGWDKVVAILLEGGAE